MNLSGITARRRRTGICAGALLAGVAVATLAAPNAVAAPDCSPEAVSGTVGSVTGAAHQYLDAHPGAKGALYSAPNRPVSQAASDIRGYFTANPQEYYELRNILAPIGEKQRQCNVTALPPQLASAYDQFMAG